MIEDSNGPIHQGTSDPITKNLMALPEIEFELTSEQYELLGYPVLTQGHPMALVLEVGVLLPDVDADG